MSAKTLAGISLILIAAGATGWRDHDYHVGIYKIRWIEETGRLQFTQQLFVDDLESAIRLSGTQITIGDDLENEEVTGAVKRYVGHHFSLSLDGRDCPLNYIGAEWDDDYHTIYFYWESAEVKQWHKIAISDNIFLEISEEQQNMHYVRVGETEKSLLLVKGRETGMLEF